MVACGAGYASYASDDERDVDGVFTVVGGGDADANVDDAVAHDSSYCFIDLSADDADVVQERVAKRQKLSAFADDASPTLALYAEAEASASASASALASASAQEEEEEGEGKAEAELMQADDGGAADGDAMETEVDAGPFAHMPDVMEEVEAEPQPQLQPALPQQPQPALPQQSKPTVCFWVGSVGLRVEAGMLERFMGGAHMLGVAARAHWRSNFMAPTSTDALAHPDQVRHVRMDSIHDPYLMHVVLDYICRRAKAKSEEEEPMYTHAFPNGGTDVVALDHLQQFIFAGQVRRSCTAVLLNEEEAAAEAEAEAEAGILARSKPYVPSHPPFIQVKYNAEMPVFTAGDEAYTSRFAEIVLVGNYVKYHNAADPANPAKLKKSQVNMHFRNDAHEDLEEMCFDPLFWGMVRERRDGVPFPAEVLKQSKAMQPRYGDKGNLDDLSFRARRRRLMTCYSAEIFYMDLLFEDAKRVLVERGVEVRVETYKLQDVPGAQKDRVAGWDVGTGHRVVFRKEAEAALEEKLAKARKSSSTSDTMLKRRADLEEELEALRAAKWFVL